MLFCSVNGEPIDHIALNDRGFAYGDGLFTTAKIYQGEIELLPQHLNRLVSGCEQLKITLPNIDELTAQVTQIAQEYSLAVLKIAISAGSGGRGYSRVGVSQPTVVITVSSFPEHYQMWQQEGINLGVCELQLGVNPMLKGLKHLNRLEQVLIRQALDQCNEDDILVSNIHGNIIETSSSNIFWRIGQQLYTPKITHSGVSGLMREFILQQQPNTVVDDFCLTDVEQAQSMFICNCIMGIVPIKTFNGKLLSFDELIGDKPSIKPDL